MENLNLDAVQNGTLSVPILHEVFSVRATIDPNVMILDIDITDAFGERYRCEYASTPDDQHGLNPMLRQWLADNDGQYEALPYVPPTLEEIRATMPSITARQLRLTLVRSGYSLSGVSAAIAAIPDAQMREEVEIEWEYATTFDRLSLSLLAIANALGLTDEQVDVMWQSAANL
jgi:protoheme ferro-lyase